MLKKDSAIRNIRIDKGRLEVFKNKINVFSVFSSPEMKVLFKYLRPYLKGIIFLISLTLTLSFLEGFKTLSIIAFIKSLFLESVDFLNNLKIFGKYEIFKVINFKDKYALIFSIFCIFILLGIISLIAKFFNSILTKKFQLTLIRNLRRDLYDKIVLFNIDFFNEAKSGELLFMINSEVSRFSNIMLHFKNFLYSFSTLFIFTAFLFYMLPIMTSVIIVLGALFIFFHQKIQKRLWVSSWQANFYQNTLQQIFYEIIYGMKLIRLGGLEDRERDEYINHHLKFEKEDIRTVKLKLLSEAAIEGFFIFIITFLSFLLFYLVKKGVLIKDSSFILSYMFVLLMAIPYFSEFQRSILCIVEAYAPLTKIIDILTKDVERKGYIKDERFTNIGGLEEIKINNLFFSYKDKEDVLKDISMEFYKGKMYAIVSLSGGGKSTLLDLMANIRRPNRGKILFNNLEIEKIEPIRLKEKIGYMNQEPLIFHDTIEENVTFFKENTTPQEIDNALAMAAIKDFVYSSPEGLNTGLGERGLTISGGERQRIGLARVFLKDPEVLFLDEATNSLDYWTEKVIYDHLKRIKKDKIIIVAAHRLSSIVDFDEIIVLHKGQVEEKGVHEELMDRKGIYHSLYKLQEIEENAKT